MSFIQMSDDWGAVKEATVAPEGKYDVRVRDVQEHLSQAGGRSIRLTIEFAGNADYATFFHYLPIVDAERDARNDADKGREPGTTRKNKMLMVKRTLHLFGVKWTDKGYDPSRLLAKTARVDVNVDAPDENAPDGARVRNSLRLPSLPDGVV